MPYLDNPPVDPAKYEQNISLQGLLPHFIYHLAWIIAENGVVNFVKSFVYSYGGLNHQLNPPIYEMVCQRLHIYIPSYIPVYIRWNLHSPAAYYWILSRGRGPPNRLLHMPRMLAWDSLYIPPCVERGNTCHSRGGANQGHSLNEMWIYGGWDLTAVG